MASIRHLQETYDLVNDPELNKQVGPLASPSAGRPREDPGERRSSEFRARRTRGAAARTTYFRRNGGEIRAEAAVSGRGPTGVRRDAAARGCAGDQARMSVAAVRVQAGSRGTMPRRGGGACGADHWRIVGGSWAVFGGCAGGLSSPPLERSRGASAADRARAGRWCAAELHHGQQADRAAREDHHAQGGRPPTPPAI